VKSLIFLKLGGSLITEKTQPRTPRLDVINRLAREIGASLTLNPELRLVVGHGSGSFGHVAAKKYGTHQGVHSPADWTGFADVWHEARLLNQIVIESLVIAGLPAMSFPPSAGVLAEDGMVLKWDICSLEAALENNLLPVVAGDVVFDTRRGGTILSTEDAFGYLARQLKPQQILLAGIEPVVWMDFPKRTTMIPIINQHNITAVAPGLLGSPATDVTGGMAQKVASMLDLAQAVPGLEILIFSGNEPGNIEHVLQGASHGTVIRAE
jgi:isopentenyl phosphate kinase